MEEEGNPPPSKEKPTHQRLFRQLPPRELVEEILVHLKLQGLTETRWFSKDELSTSTLDEWVPLLEPYYLPCKAKRFLTEIDTARLITILRHILTPLHYELRTQERMYKLQKMTMYQICSLQKTVVDLSANRLCVAFE
jgi:hypothetical protein